MPNTTLRAKARTTPDEQNLSREEALIRRDLWEGAYAEYLAARADLYAEHADESIEASMERGRREDAAETALLSAPAPAGWALMQKWAVVEAILTDERVNGERTYPTTILGLAALKADVLALVVEERTGGRQ